MEIMGQIIDFFSTRKKVADADIHELANSLGIDKHQFEERIYSLITSIFNAGKFKKNPPQDVDKEELKKGIKAEMIHTDSEAIARKLAMDQLSMMPDYYTRLEKMKNDKA